jgi:hypothetical protein
MGESTRQVAIIGIVLFLVVAGLLLLFAGQPWRERPSLEKAIQRLGFTPAVPPTRYLKPGSVVLVNDDGSVGLGIVCTAEGSLGFRNEWEFLDSETIAITATDEFDGRTAFGLDVTTLFAGSAEGRAVKTITVSLTSARILTITDERVFERFGSRSAACADALAFRRSGARPLTMVRSALMADATFRIEYESSADMELRASETERLAAHVGGKVRAGAGQVIVGEQLLWGIVDDPDLLDIGVGGSTGTADRPRLLDSDVRIRTVELDPVVSLGVRPVQQPSVRSCWAAAGAMLWNHVHNTDLDAAEFAEQLGDDWKEAFDADRGLALDEHMAFADAAGFAAMPPMNPAIEQFAQWLEKRGPVWIATVGPPSFSAHARVLVAMYGDLTPHGTEMAFIDPRDGRLVREPFMGFIESFEREARAAIDAAPDADLRIQILHP